MWTKNSAITHNLFDTRQLQTIMIMKLVIILCLITIFISACSSKHTSTTEIGNKGNLTKSDSLLILKDFEEKYDQSETFLKFDKGPKPIGGMNTIANKLYYTSLAASYYIEGRILVKFVVKKDGRTNNIRIIEGLGYGLDEIAISAIETTRFEPGELDGEPIAVETILPLEFILR